MSKQYLAMQVGNTSGFADRYFQSFLASGGIAALGYSGLIVNNLSSLLTFREIYVVPLASDDGRDVKLERILQGLVLISIPCAVFLFTYADPIISVLLQRGKFTVEAALLTAMVLRIQALSLVLSTIITPMERMFQVLNRISLTQLRYIVALLATMAFQYMFVFRYGMDVRGVAWAGLCTSFVILCLVVVLVRRCGIVLRWGGVIGNGFLALLIAGAAAAISLLAASQFEGLIALSVGGALYGLVVGSGYYLTMRRRMQLIVG